MGKLPLSPDLELSRELWGGHHGLGGKTPWWSPAQGWWERPRRQWLPLHPFDLVMPTESAFFAIQHFLYNSMRDRGRC